MEKAEIYQKLKKSDLKVTPQRIAVYSTLLKLNHHPNVDEIVKEVQTDHPGISVGTIYNILDAFVDHGLISRVKTEKGAMLYDVEEENHHHLFDRESGQIKDFFDQDLTRMIKEYLEKSGIPDFDMDDIQLHINGKFKNK